MRKIYALALLITMFIFFTSVPAHCRRYIDEEKGICYDTLPQTSLDLRFAGKHKWLITVDGMDPGSTFNPFHGDNWSYYVYEYLDNKFVAEFEKSGGVIIAISWARDVSKSEDAINILREKIQWANSRREPVTILSHSWGTVISYVTLQRYKYLNVDKLITVGSPLASKNEYFFNFTKGFLAAKKLSVPVSKPNNLKVWHNFHIKCDAVSGRIDSLPKYSNFGNEKDDYGSLSKCHRAYFGEDDFIWKSIQKDSMGFVVFIYDPVKKKTVYVSGEPKQ